MKQKINCEEKRFCKIYVNWNKRLLCRKLIQAERKADTSNNLFFTYKLENV